MRMTKLIFTFRNFAECAQKWSQDGRIFSWSTKLWEWLLPCAVSDVGVRKASELYWKPTQFDFCAGYRPFFLRNALNYLHFCAGILYHFLRFNMPLKCPSKSSHDEDPITNHCRHNELRLVLRKTSGYMYYSEHYHTLNTGHTLCVSVLIYYYVTPVPATVVDSIPHWIWLRFCLA